MKKVIKVMETRLNMFGKEERIQLNCTEYAGPEPETERVNPFLERLNKMVGEGRMPKDIAALMETIYSTQVGPTYPVPYFCPFVLFLKYDEYEAMGSPKAGELLEMDLVAAQMAP
jgi:hypothetical protein